MNFLLHILCIVLSTSIITGQAQNSLTLLMCGKNEKYMCGPTTCVETCPLATSSALCRHACYCADGYVRESDKPGSPCIKREQCPKITKDDQVCGENEEYTTCGFACAPTCNDLRYPLPKPLKACILLCKIGCVCKKGYYLSDDGKCVPPEKCCGENEKYNECGSACVETCQYKPEGCTRQCVPGCFCSCSDYVRQGNGTDSPCIHRDNCSKGCDEDD